MCNQAKQAVLGGVQTWIALLSSDPCEMQVVLEECCAGMITNSDAWAA